MECFFLNYRDKERRIAHILQYVWSNLVGNQTRPSTPINNETVRERFTPVNPSTSSFYGGIQSIAASCNIPPAVESEAWSVQNSFNLYFNLTAQYPDIFRSVANSEIFSSEQQQSMESGQSHEYVPNVGTRPLFSPTTVTPKKSVNIVSAKLRLYKTVSAVSPDVSTLLTIEPSEPCNDIEATSDSDEVEPNPFPTRVTISEPSPITDKKIRVSVYWYTQPATKNHYKKKLVDAKMLSLRESSWVEFDIKNAVKAWLNDRRPNYGLVVEVENEDQDALDPSKYFRSAPCVKSSSETEVTNGAVQEQENSDKSGGDMNTSSSSPVIEICSLNVPEASTSYEQTKFFPLSMNINSFNHLRRVAESHAKSSNGSQNPWQTINLPALSPEIFDSGIERSNETSEPTDVASHRHRHHHGSNSQNGTNNFMRHIQPTAQNRSRVSHPRNLLGEDHPLRTILATVNGNSKELNKRGSSTLTQHLPESLVKGFPLDVMSQMHADESSKVRADYHDSIENDKDVFITKIVITPAQRNDNSLHRLAGTRGLFPFGSLSSIYPTNPTNSDSTER
ncbi:unnamed protein product [Orchesella dallaii]|uniref:TGF-beta propeptide domain-containing protein n=1 Tax=Orchesella dallaii TaxID=48710 RepID=A0ABP1QRL9_9HEXA